MTNTIKYPKGYRDEEGFTKISIKFTDKLFSELIKMAKREEKSFNAMIIELVLVGKLDLEESDACEPRAELPMRVTS